MSRSTLPSQLPLRLFVDARYRFETYSTADNAQAVAALQAWVVGAGPPHVALWGGTATGKSHLAQAAIAAADGRGLRAMYIAVREVLELGPQLLEDLHEVDVLALDGIDCAVGHSAWEQALFNLYNECQSAGKRLLTASRLAPGACGYRLRDLSSRLQSGLCFQLREIDDLAKREVLRAAAERRGLDLPAAVAAYIMRTERRDLSALAEILDLLDEASLRAARPLTIPFVRDVLGARDDHR